jgi:hypothetical protein
MCFWGCSAFLPPGIDPPFIASRLPLADMAVGAMVGALAHGIIRNKPLIGEQHAAC